MKNISVDGQGKQSLEAKRTKRKSDLILSKVMKVNCCFNCWNNQKLCGHLRSLTKKPLMHRMNRKRFMFRQHWPNVKACNYLDRENSGLLKIIFLEKRNEKKSKSEKISLENCSKVGMKQSTPNFVDFGLHASFTRSKVFVNVNNIRSPNGNYSPSFIRGKKPQTKKQRRIKYNAETITI